MSEITWIKLKTDMFENDKIKLIEALPAADTIIVIWVKLLAAAGKANLNGYIMLTENIPMNTEEMATIFNRDINTVRLALQTFQRYGMIEVEGEAVRIKNWEVHQNIDGMERAKQLTRERVRRHRERKKQVQLEAPNEENHSNVSVTLRNATDIDKELDIDIDIEKEIDKEKKDIVPDKSDTIPYASILDYLNEKANTAYRATSKATQQLIKARFSEGFTEHDFYKVIDNKTTTWLNTDFAKYLRPQTLFGTKFEGYLNERVKGNENVRGSNGSNAGESKPSLRGFCSN